VDPRIVLRRLIARLEPEIGHTRPVDFSGWEGEQLPSAAAGRLHLAQALQDAREALASGDKTRIAEAAMSCPTLERTGRDMGQRHNRKAGGARRGAAQTSAAAEAWKPWVQMYEGLLAKGVPCLKARRQVEVAMAKGGSLPTKEMPERSTLRKWLPKPSAQKSARS
jgi:hypothetical protein